MEIKLPKSKPKMLDFVIIFAVLCLTLLSSYLIYSGADMGNDVCITTESERFYLSLSENQTKQISSGGFNYTVEVKDGAASVINADCPDKICVNSPSVSNAGGSVICVPGGLIVTIGSDNEADIIIP